MASSPSELEDAAVELSRRVMATYLQTWGRLLHADGYRFEGNVSLSLSAHLHAGDPVALHHLREAVRSCRRVGHGRPPDPRTDPV